MNKKFISVLFLISLAFSTLHADDIDTLLDIYAKENDLSKKTKKEAAGTVLVYTRQDLESMQVKSLSELLKSIPFYRYNENKLGYSDLLRNDGFPSVSSDARVYINEREVISPFYGNGIGIVSKLDLAYIDHIEIYTGVTSFEFGVEPASMVIRIYTKDPNREVGGQITANYSSYDSSEYSVSYADILNDFSYYAYVNRKNSNEEDITHANTPLSRDKESVQVFLSLQNDTNRIEYNKIEGKSDLFMDNVAGGDGSPTDSNTEVTYNLLGWYSTYFDDKLSLSLDMIQADVKTHQADRPYIDFMRVPASLVNPFAAPTDTLDLTYNNYSSKSEEKQLSAVLKYKEKIGNHNFLGGLQFRKKDFKIKEIKANVNGQIISDIFIPLPSAIEVDVNENLLPNLFKYTQEKVYGVFLEDTYSIGDKQAIVAAMKHDVVKPNGNFEKQNLSLYRLGYIYSDEKFSFKTFLVSTESRFDPNYYTRYDIVGKLAPQRDDSINIEAKWIQNSFEHTLNLFRTKQTNKLYSQNGVQNLSKPYYQDGISYTNVYNFNQLNRINTNFFIKKIENTLTNEGDTVYGGHVRVLNTIGKFNLYNELIYRDGYDGIKAGYDFNSAITYNHSRDLKFYIKGENIFDKAIKTIYTDRDKVAPYNRNTLGPISVTSPRVWLGMEYRF